MVHGMKLSQLSNSDIFFTAAKWKFGIVVGVLEIKKAKDISSKNANSIKCVCVSWRIILVIIVTSKWVLAQSRCLCLWQSNMHMNWLLGSRCLGEKSHFNRFQIISNVISLFAVPLSCFVHFWRYTAQSLSDAVSRFLGCYFSTIFQLPIERNWWK